MKKKIQILCVGLITLNLQLITHNSFSQNVGINADGSSPDTNTMLDVKSTGTTSATYALKVKDGDGNNKVVIRSDGNVGIGLTNPTRPLAVNTSNTTTVLSIENKATDGDPILTFRNTGVRNWTLGLNDGDADKFMISTNSNVTLDNNVRFTMTTGGNVGVGTTSPARRLHVAGSNNTDISSFSTLGSENGTILQNTNGTDNTFSYLGFAGNNGTPNAVIYGYTEDQASNHAGLTIGTNGANGYRRRVTVEPEGYVGIGHTNPTAILHVSEATNTSFLVDLDTQDRIRLRSDQVSTNEVSLESAGNTHVIIDYNGNGTNSYFSVGHDNESIDATELFRVQENGNVGIGTISPGFLLQVGNAGDGTEARANAWNNLSDRRLKTNINPISDPLEKVKELEGVYFDWKSTGKRSVGFIAQEVEKVLPEIVTMSKSDGYLSMQYDNITAILVEAIKEQQQIIDTFRQENIQQTKVIQELRSEINTKNMKTDLRIQQLEEHLKEANK